MLLDSFIIFMESPKYETHRAVLGVVLGCIGIGFVIELVTR